MAFYWRILHYEPDGTTSKGTLDKDDAIVALDAFDVEPSGNCGEGAFTIIPSQLNINPRDVIVFQTSPNNSTWTSRYRGMVVSAPSKRVHEPRTVRTVGLKQRFYERTYDLPVIDSDDPATMAYDMLATTMRPSGTTISSGNFPTTGFTLGAIYPGEVSLGVLLDMLAESVGAFVVPTGEGPYSYDGTNYADGAEVPAVQWGVDANGATFFRRPQASAVVLDESDSDTEVEWGDINAEEVWDAIWVVFLWGVDLDLLRYVFTNTGTTPDNPLEAAWEPLMLYDGLSEVVGADYNEKAIKRVYLENPLDYMQAEISYGFLSLGGTWSGSGNVADGDDGTFAVPSTTGASTLELPTASSVGRGLWRVRYKSNSIIYARVKVGNNSDTEVCQATYALPASPDGASVVWLPALTFDGYTGSATKSRIQIVALAGSNDLTNLYELTYYTPDTSAAQKLADSYKREPQADVASVRVFDVGLVSQDATLSPWGEADIDLPIERITYSVTVEDGVSTTYHVGQRFPSDLAAQRALLERLVRNEIEKRQRRQARIQP